MPRTSICSSAPRSVALGLGRGELLGLPAPPAWTLLLLSSCWLSLCVAPPTPDQIAFRKDVATTFSVRDRFCVVAIGGRRRPAPPANAADKRQIASITASGLVFKDKLIVDAFADPKVEGVTLYVSDFERPVVERVQKDFFSDPSQSGLACSRRAAPLKVGNIDTSAEGEDVVSEAKSLLFKTLRVKRIVDKEANALVYVSYSTRTRLCENHNLMARSRRPSTRLTG